MGRCLPIYLIDLIEMRRGDDTRYALRPGVVRAEITGENLSPLDAWSRFQSSRRSRSSASLREVYIQELKAAGDNQLTLDANGRPINGGYAAATQAIETLFPGKDWSGDVKIGNATFRTMAGGSIETLTPGGGLQVAALGALVPRRAGPRHARLRRHQHLRPRQRHGEPLAHPDLCRRRRSDLVHARRYRCRSRLQDRARALGARCHDG
jgi:filamentous hemagglutinin